jgi:hypothetical protein
MRLVLPQQTTLPESLLMRPVFSERCGERLRRAGDGRSSVPAHVSRRGRRDRGRSSGRWVDGQSVHGSLSDRLLPPLW